MFGNIVMNPVMNVLFDIKAEDKYDFWPTMEPFPFARP